MSPSAATTLPGPAAVESTTLRRPTPAESAEIGKAARKATRSAHGSWSPPVGRDPIAILEAQDRTRVEELVPIRWGRMLVSPFRFYRGGAALMAADLASTPDSGLRTQLCGDAHISNFGGFAAPDRELVFDLNDFDETLPGLWEWDVKRMAASVEIAGRDRGEKRAVRQALVRGSVERYREAMREFAAMTNLALWYSRLEVTDLVREFEAPREQKGPRAVDKLVRKARAKDSTRALTRLTEMIDGAPRFRCLPPLLVPLDELLGDHDDAAELKAYVHRLLRGYKGLARDRRHLYESYAVVDIVRKVVGVGSVGTRGWIVLLLGRDASDPLVLQANAIELILVAKGDAEASMRHQLSKGTSRRAPCSMRPTEASIVSDREAADVTRRHHDERQRAIKEIAERNRKAHEAAVKRRQVRDAIREALRRDLSF